MRLATSSDGKGRLLLGVGPDPNGRIPDVETDRLLKTWRKIRQNYNPSRNLLRSSGLRSATADDPAFGVEKAVDGNGDTYWTAPDGNREAQIEADLADATERRDALQLSLADARVPAPQRAQQGQELKALLSRIDALELEWLELGEQLQVIQGAAV